LIWIVLFREVRKSVYPEIKQLN